MAATGVSIFQSEVRPEGPAAAQPLGGNDAALKAKDVLLGVDPRQDNLPATSAGELGA